MIVGGAFSPCPPLLATELTGQEEPLPELRAACSAATARLIAAAPDLIAVVGPDEKTAAWDPGGRLDLAAYAPAVARSRQPGAAPTLPLSLGIGTLLLDEAGYAGPRAR